MYDRIAARRMLSDLLYEHAVTLLLEDGNIRINARDASMVTPEVRETIRANKQLIVYFMSTPPVESKPCAGCGVLNDWRWLQCCWICSCYFEPERRDAYRNLQHSMQRSPILEVDYSNGRVISRSA